MSNRSDSIIPLNNLKQCTVCCRKFTLDSINTHEVICQKRSENTRKRFNISQQRIRGTEAEKFIKAREESGKINTQTTHSPTLTTNWRQKHEDLIKQIKDAKNSMIQKIKKVSDLPLPPTIYSDDYIQCPHCMRNFNQLSAERHIFVCASMVYNVTTSKASLVPCSKSKSSQASTTNK